MSNNNFSTILDSIIFIIIIIIIIIKNKQNLVNKMNDEKFHVFLSYNHKIKNQVKQIEEKLINNGLRVFRDENDEDGLKVNGNDLSGQLVTAISASKIFICCITEQYCASHVCNQEIQFANKSKPIIVLMIENLSIEKIHLINVIKSNDNYPCGIGLIIK